MSMQIQAQLYIVNERHETLTSDDAVVLVTAPDGTLTSYIIPNKYDEPENYYPEINSILNDIINSGYKLLTPNLTEGLLSTGSGPTLQYSSTTYYLTVP
tara:strand:- start:329 stop:625 length:297 start_codon:yes stop_codon:yes gene_type:complete